MNTTVGTIETQIEDEVRHLILRMDHRLLAQLSPERILQGYHETGRDDVSLRIRISNGHHATRVRKEGIGQRRRETTEHLSLERGREELARCPHRLEKLRYRITDGWEIDVYAHELEGIVLAEWERPEGYDGPAPPLPPWITKAIDVTDRLTNYHLAKLATELKILKNPSAPQAVEEFLAPTIPMVVLTGGPCAGKTSIIHELGLRPSNDLLLLPEVATILIDQVKAIPNAQTERGRLAFQRAVRGTQLIFEEIAQHTARAQGTRLIVGDRGTIDSAAYMDGGLSDYLQMSGRSLQEEFKRYAAVIHLRIPDEATYVANRANNPARSENYAAAVELDNRIGEVWKDHPRYLSVANYDGWPRKKNHAISLIEGLLKNLPPIEEQLSLFR